MARSSLWASSATSAWRGALPRPGTSRSSAWAVSPTRASAARLQLVVLIPAAITAVLLAPLARPDPGVGRLRAMWRAVSEHRLLFGVLAAALVAGLARTATNGGNLPLAGRYANVGHSHA